MSRLNSPLNKPQVRRADKSEMPEAVLVKMTPAAWEAIRAFQKQGTEAGEEISAPEALRRFAAEWLMSADA